MPTAQQLAIVDSAIERVQSIATLPAITARILEISSDPEGTPRDLHDIVVHDPVLASRILKTVNSAFYGVRGQIGSINRAIGLLGISAVRNLAVAAGMKEMCRGGNFGPSYSGSDLWLHSVATAIGSRLLAEELRLGLPDEAFLAGLLHDIGIMLEMQAMPEEFEQLVHMLHGAPDGTPAADMLALELQLFGAGHEAFVRLCESWNFPRVLIDVPGHHHDPMALPPGHRLLACTVYVADRLAAMLGCGFRGDLQSLDPAPEVLEGIGATIEQLSRVSERLPDAYEEAKAALG